jgi:putative ABC transport system permease protein
VGVVADIRHLGPESPSRQECYIPLAQNETIGATLVMRTAGDPVAVLPAVKAAIWSVNNEQRLTGDIVTLEGYMDRLIAQRRFNMALLALFGVLGLIIAAVGIYGVMAYVVAQRTKEIGVRMALGATPRDVVGMILGRASLLMLLGLVIGGAGAWYLSAGVRTFLFEVEPANAGIVAASIAALAAAGLLASAIPARRAATVDPLIALRHE